MNTDKNQTDIFKDLFSSMPEEKLPSSLRSDIMQQIIKESAKRKKRNDFWELLAIIFASFGMIGLASFAFIYMKIPSFSIHKLDFSSFPFFFYIGAIVLLLLFTDYKLRQTFYKDK